MTCKRDLLNIFKIKKNDCPRHYDIMVAFTFLMVYNKYKTLNSALRFTWAIISSPNFFELKINFSTFLIKIWWHFVLSRLLRWSSRSPATASCGRIISILYLFDQMRITFARSGSSCDGSSDPKALMMSCDGTAGSG